MTQPARLPQANIDLQFDPEVQAELEAALERLKTNVAFYRSWCIMRGSNVTGRITLKYDKRRLKGIEPCPFLDTD